MAIETLWWLEIKAPKAREDLQSGEAPTAGEGPVARKALGVGN